MCVGGQDIPVIEEQEQQMEILENKYKELNDWLKKRDDEQIMMASTGGRVDKALTGRSRDI